MDKSPDKLMVVAGSIQSGDLISHWLTREGFTEVFSVDKGQSALVKADMIKPDIIIINVDLPDISGFDLCKRIKRFMPYVLILCISHIDNKANRVRALESGADDYMETGDSYQFISKIRSLVRLKQLSNEIRKQYAELEQRNRLMESHMRMGRRVQRALIPDINMSFNDCKIMSLYQPAMGVGGDFYNVLSLDEHKLGIVMGDVSGHGIAASFLTVTLNVMIKNLSDWHFNPRELLFHLNNEMCELFGRGDDDPDFYACVFYALIDTENKQIQFANAGLVSPLQMSEPGIFKELSVFGAPIGMIKDIQYKQETISYSKGDTLLFYTDGLQDCYYKNQPDEFIRQTKDLLSELSDQEDMRKILDTVCRSFYKMDASDNERMEMDDVSMLLCRL